MDAAIAASNKHEILQINICVTRSDNNVKLTKWSVMVNFNSLMILLQKLLF